MQRVLSLLVAFVFFQTQAWALSGGPFQQTQGSNIIGTYAGVLIPTFDPLLDVVGTNIRGEPLATSIGLFAFAQPDVGFASGPLLAFVEGTPLLGTIIGLIDPEDAHFQAVISGQSTYTVAFNVDGDGTIVATERIPIQATGNVDAQIEPTLTGTSTGLNAARVVGTAGIDIFLDTRKDGTPRVSNTLFFDIEGFKQSDTATAVTLTFTTPGTGVP